MSRGTPRSDGPRVVLFTDTLGDVNGVSRFIRNAAEMARETGRSLTVLTSTNFAVPDERNIVNVKPVFATKMPKYENLELVLPPVLKMLGVARSLRPDVIHISTPGSVGLVGLLAAKVLGCPVIGVYHTDFPAYIEKLFHNESMTLGCDWFMRAFYGRFASIFTRSDDYAARLMGMGIARERLHTLRPGIMTEQFQPGARDVRAIERTINEAAGARDAAGNGNVSGAPHDARAVRFLYCGRVSVEKNMPLLERVWERADASLREKGVAAELVVIGDGPYREQMERELRSAGTRVSFLGFRYGAELTTLYASCDVFVFPSTTDTLGQVVMESQSSGLPVVVSDEGGPKEVVRDGETGFVISARDESEWVARIVELGVDASLREKMGRAAHEFMQQFSMARSFEHYWEVHERVFAERR